MPPSARAIACCCGSRSPRCAIPQCDGASSNLTRQEEDGPWQASFTAAPVRRRIFEPGSKRRKTVAPLSPPADGTRRRPPNGVGGRRRPRSIIRAFMRLVRRSWTEENVTFAGRILRVTGSTIAPRPAVRGDRRRPKPPLRGWARPRRRGRAGLDRGRPRSRPATGGSALDDAGRGAFASGGCAPAWHRETTLL